MKPTMRFLRHDGIRRPMGISSLKSLGRSTAPRPGSAQAAKDAPEVLRPTHRRDEFRPVIPQRVARQHCPPPLHRHAHPNSVPGSGAMDFQRTVNSVLTVPEGSRPRNPMKMTQAIHNESRAARSKKFRTPKRPVGRRPVSRRISMYSSWSRAPSQSALHTMYRNRVIAAGVESILKLLDPSQNRSHWATFSARRDSARSLR